MTEKDGEEVEFFSKGHEKLINTDAATILEKTPTKPAHDHQGSSSLKTQLCVAAALLCGVAIAGLVFAAGAIVGRVSALWSTAGVCQNSTYNWGDHVTISGESVPVISWFDEEIRADYIRSKLQ